MAVSDILCSANDGTVRSYNATYATARSGGTLNVVDLSDEYVRCGQEFSTPDYFCFEAFLEFDLASIPAGSTINSAILSLYANAGDHTATDFILRVRDYDYGPAVATGDFVAGASLSATGTLRAHYDTAGGWGASYHAFTNDAMPAAVAAAAGSTLRLIAYSSRQEAGTTPTGLEYAYFGGYASPASGHEAKLTIDYTPPVVASGPAFLGGGFF